MDVDVTFRLLYFPMGLYLQRSESQGIPSTCKTGVPTYEYAFKCRDAGQKAYVQVKRDAYPWTCDYEMLESTVFLFASGGDHCGEASDLEFIEPNVVRVVRHENRQIPQDRVVEWTYVLRSEE